MRLKLTQLTPHVKKSLNTVYLITGNEPLQMGEAADYIRLIAKKSGYQHREIFSVEGNFKWGQITTATENLSIFSEKKIIDLRVPSAKFGIEGAKMIIQYCQRHDSETILLISCGKLTAAHLKSRWVNAVDKVGVIVQVWPLEGDYFINWLQQRLVKRGLKLPAAAVQRLAACVEGNALAAHQEIEKLYSLYGSIPLTTEQVQAAVTDSARFNVFQLSDAVLLGQVRRVIKILRALQAENIAPPVILWMLARECRCLIELKMTANKELVFKKYYIWDKRKILLTKATHQLSLKTLQGASKLSAIADRQIKGQQQGDCWETLFEMCLQLANFKRI
ncbi:MAG: DNA polymerase III subunit delta [Methylococcales bacterium]|nr:DNA polymerase III subunit delta [Methylococcales bacterium]